MELLSDETRMERRKRVKEYIEGKLSGMMPYKIENPWLKKCPDSTLPEVIVFTAPDGTPFSISSFGDKEGKFDCIVAEYWGEGCFSEDGDTYWIDDYDSPDALFQDLLQEKDGIRISYAMAWPFIKRTVLSSWRSNKDS